MKKIILASASPRRRELLEGVGAVFEVIPSDFDEKAYVDSVVNSSDSPIERCISLAKGKALDVYKNNVIADGDVVVGVDTVVVINNEVLEKPVDKKDALRMLSLLSNNTHFVVSAFAIVDSKGSVYTDYEKTFVKMREILPEEAENYVLSENVYDKAGSYAIQGKASLFIESINGDYFNVVGLPIFKLAQALKRFEVHII